MRYGRTPERFERIFDRMSAVIIPITATSDLVNFLIYDAIKHQINNKAYNSFWIILIVRYGRTPDVLENRYNEVSALNFCMTA